MGIDISKFSQEQQVVLNALDKNKDGIIDKENDGIDEEAIGALLNPNEQDKPVDTYTTNPVTATSTSVPSPTEGMTEKQARKYKKEALEAHIGYLETFVKDDGTRAGVLEMLDKKANLDPEFRKAVADVMALMPATYASSDDIKHKDLVKKLPAGMKDDLHEDILKQLEKMAKNECIAEQTSQIADAYAEKMAKYVDGNGNPTKTSQQIMNEIKQEAKSAGKFKGDFKEAFKEFNQPMIDAYQKVYAAIAQIKDLEKGGKVQDKAEDILKANGQWDKYTKKALLGDRNVFKRFKIFITGYKGDGRIASDNQGRWNKVEHKKIQTTEQIMDALGNKTELFVALQETGFIKKTETGEWDLTELSELIGTRVGTDAKLNRDSKKDELVAEKLNTKAALRVATGLSELDDKHAEALVKLCGYEIEGKNWGRALFRGLLGAAGGGALTAGSAYGAAKLLPKDIVFKAPYYKDKTYDISAELAAKLKENLPEGVTIDPSGSIHIITDILVEGKLPRLAGQLGKLGLYGSVPGDLAGAALGILSGLEDKGQTPVLANNFTETTFEAYCENLKKTNSPYASIGILIASSFIDKNGNWDREGYKDFLNTMGGDKNCIINREELIGGLQKRQKALQAKDNVENNNNNDNNGDDNNCVNDKCNVGVEEQKGEETTEVTDRTFIHLRKDNPGVGWKEMVEAYFPGLIEACGGMKNLYGANGAIKAFQRELCTDENGNFDRAKFVALINATDVPREIKIPLQVKGINRVETKPTPAGQVDPPEEGKSVAAMDRIGRNEKVTTKKVGASTYLATDGCNDHTASGTSPKEAVENLEKQENKRYANRGEYVQ